MSKTTISYFPSYKFKGKDPDIHVLRAEERKQLRTRAQIATDAGVSKRSLDAWFDGETMKPSNCRIEAVGRSMGIKRKWVSL